LWVGVVGRFGPSRVFWAAGQVQLSSGPSLPPLYLSFEKKRWGVSESGLESLWNLHRIRAAPFPIKCVVLIFAEVTCLDL